MSMKHRRAVVLFLILILGYANVAAEQRELVLVTDVQNNISDINQHSLRRIFLGLNVKGQKTNFTPIGNLSEEFAHEVFLQKVVHMSARTYERHLLTKVITRGNQRIQIAHEKNVLLKALKYNENAISYMWRKEAGNYKEIKIIQTIWQGSVQP